MSALAIALDASVMLRIMEYERSGGPTTEDYERARSASNLLAEKGDVLLFGGTTKGEAAEIFNRVTDAVAVLAFCPGGVQVFGNWYKASL